MIIRYTSIALLLCSLLFASPLAAENNKGLYFASKPSLSPDSKEIYFSYSGEIFKVNSLGGIAMRVVSMNGIESNPKVSPDGKWLAFSSTISGDNNVFVISTTGGEVTQLTFNDANDVPVGWSPDSKKIYFESNRYNNISTYSIDLTGGTPVRLFPNYFNTIANLTENPATGEFLFNESTESYRFATRKGYKGDHNPNIKSWNPKTREYLELTSYRGKDIWPMADKNGNIYFVSDEKNGEANIAKIEYSGDVNKHRTKWLTSFGESIQYPSISFNGEKIVFIKDYKISVLNIAENKVYEPKIELVDDRIAGETSFSIDRVEDFALSPDGKKLASVYRGRLFVSDTKGNFVQELNTDKREKVSEVAWGDDSNTLFFVRTDLGKGSIYKIKADRSDKEHVVYKTKHNIRGIVASNDNKLIAFIDGPKNLSLLNASTGKVSVLAELEFWSFQSYPISFSSDDKYITFNAMNMFDTDVYICNIANKEVVNITNSASTEESPIFSKDGKDLYFVANRYDYAFPRGASVQLYKLPLYKYQKNFKTEEFDKLFENKDNRANSKGQTHLKDSSIVINRANMQQRYKQLMSNGSQSQPYIFSTSDKSYLLFGSNHEGSYGIYIQELAEWDQKAPKKIKDLTSVNKYSSNGKELYAHTRKGIFKIDPLSATASAINIQAAFTKSLKDEFYQMFYEVWALLDENFYDVTFHGIDWQKKRDYYEKFLPYIKSRDELRTLINDMLNELNSSHLGFSTSGKEELSGNRHYSSQSGILFQENAPYTVDRILTGSASDYDGNPIKKGDILIKVDNLPVNQRLNREQYFVSPVKKDEITLTFKGSDGEKSIRIHPNSTEEIKSLLYAEWEDNNRNLVERVSKGKIAYLHMRDMGSESLDKFYIEMNTYAVHKDALILDLRFNNGGNVHKEVIDFLSQKQHFRWSYRDYPSSSHPSITPSNKPIIVLVNERSLSDAEVTSNGIKTLGIAKLVGTETYRWIIFTSAAQLVDGSVVRLPAWGCYTLDGKDLEFQGVSPDVYIKNTFKDRVEFKDPQLEKAINLILNY